MLNTFLTDETQEVILYIAFRAAYLTTFQELLDEFESDRMSGSPSGFLAKLPIAAGCAPQVQLNLLLKTWQKVHAGCEDLTDLDRCVCFYTVGELARLAQSEDRHVMKSALCGPKIAEVNGITWLCSSLRLSQITGPFPIEAINLQREISDLADTTGDSSNLESNTCLTDVFLELLGQWTVSTQILDNANGLLTLEECHRLGRFFSQHPQLMNL